MIDNKSCPVVYMLDAEIINIVAVATDTFFEEQPATSQQMQVSDIDVEIEQVNIRQTAGFIPLDVGGFAVIQSLKHDMIELGCSEMQFREMTVNGQHNILWQVCAPGIYEIINDGLDAAPGSNYYRGPIDDTPLELRETSKAPIGCFVGREDYQELVFSKYMYEGLKYKYEIAELFVGIPLYDECLLSIIAVKYDAIGSNGFDCFDSEYLDILRVKELFAVLKFASYHGKRQLGNEVYKKLKSSTLPLTDKKEVLRLYKSLKAD